MGEMGRGFQEHRQTSCDIDLYPVVYSIEQSHKHFRDVPNKETGGKNYAEEYM